MDRERAQQICDRFRLGRFDSCEAAGGTRNLNFVFHTACGPWFVRRRFTEYSAPAQLAFDHGAAQFLHRRHVPVTLPRPDIAGNSWWHDGAHVWEVFAFVEGRELQSGAPPDIAALAEALAQWHRAGEAFPARYEKAAPRGETDPRQLLARAARIAAEAPATGGVLMAYREAVERAARDLDDAKYSALPHTLIHGDVQPANILLRNGRVAAFVDLDWCAWRARLYDLAFALLTCCAGHADVFDGADIWSLTQAPILRREHLEKFLATYTRAGTPLTPQEKRALPAQLVLTWCHMRLGGALKVAPERRREFLQRAPDISSPAWLPWPN